MGKVVEDMVKASSEVARICAATPPRPHHGALLAAVNSLLPGMSFRLALTRSGWYRLGGVITSSGDPIATDIQDWAERAWQASDEDPLQFAEIFGPQELLATRVDGRTHYFVAPYGSLPAQFMQLEVEELQEVSDRQLFDRQRPPVDLQELVDPRRPLRVEGQSLAAPRYALRRLTDVASYLEEMERATGTPPLVARFMNEWQQSTASHIVQFCQEWVLSLAEHLDRFKQTLRTATPIAAPRRRESPFSYGGPDGADLANVLYEYDRHVGYPFAWYFHMVTNRGVPRAIATHVAHDLDAGFSYLPERDATILRAWLDTPYSI